jgi:hypothetical protein
VGLGRLRAGDRDGAATEQIALTVGPLPVQVRDPATIARAAASTAALVRCPVGVGLGTSSVRVVERRHGRSWRRAATALAESAQAVRAFLREGQADFDVSPALASEYREKLVALAKRGPPGAPAGCLDPGRGRSGPESYAQIMRSLVGNLEVALRRDVRCRGVRLGRGDGPRGCRPRSAAERIASGGGGHGWPRRRCRRNRRAPGGLRRRDRRDGARPGRRRRPRWRAQPGRPWPSWPNQRLWFDQPTGLRAAGSRAPTL